MGETKTLRIAGSLGGGATIEEITEVVNNAVSDMVTEESVKEVVNEAVASVYKIDLQEKTVTPTTEDQTVVADGGYDGLFSVTVVGDEDLNPYNIRYGKELFGVTGQFVADYERLKNTAHSCKTHAWRTGGVADAGAVAVSPVENTAGLWRNAVQASSASSTTLTETVRVNESDWVLAITMSRSTTTYPDGWTLLHESTVLTYDNSYQRMAFLCKQVTEAGEESFTLTQSSSGYLEVILATFSDVDGFAYHEGTEYYSNIQSGAVTVQKPEYENVVWGCTTNYLTTGKFWACAELPYYYMYNIRSAIFLDEDMSTTDRTFTMPHTTDAVGAIVDCVELLKS